MIACFVLLYFDTIVHMVHDWSTNDNYSHGFLVPFITGYLIWKDRAILSGMKPSPSNIGLICLVASLGFFVVANIGAELFTMRSSMILVALSGTLFLFGKQITRHVAPAILYLFFMIPFPAIIWNKIALPLKLFATTVAVSVIKILNIPVHQEGNIIQLANTTLEVVDACSGLRSLVSLLALSAAFAMITEHSRLKKMILFLSAVPLAIILNVIRLTMTAVLSKYYGPKVAQGFFHDVSGMLVFVVAMVLLWGINSMMVKKQC